MNLNFRHAQVLMLCLTFLGCGRISNQSSSSAKDASLHEKDDAYCVDYPLHCAARDGDEVLIRKLVKYGHDVKGKDKEQRSPIHLATAAGQITSVRVLIELKAPLEDPNGQGKTPLLIAADPSVSVDMFRTLLELGASISAVDRDGQSAGHLAMQDAARLNLLHDRQFDFKLRNKKGQTVLHVAAGQQDAAIVALVASWGSDINAQDNDGLTALHVASAQQATEVLKTILALKPDLNLKSKNGRSAFLTAVAANNLENVNLLVKAGAQLETIDQQRLNAVHIATLNNNAALVEALLQFGVNPSKGSSLGTPLEIAITKDFTDMGAFLFTKGALLNEGQKDRFVLQFAIENRKIKSVEKLLDAGADVNYWSETKRKTPLQTAIASGQIDIAKMLLTRSANPDDAGPSPDNSDNRPLFMAYRNFRNIEIFKLLINAGANPHIELKEYNRSLTDLIVASPDRYDFFLILVGSSKFDVSKETKALFTSIQMSNSKAALLLVDKGADPNAMNSDKKTAYYEAVRQGSSELVAAMEKHGAKMDLRYEENLGLYWLAAARWDRDDALVERLIAASTADINAKNSEGKNFAHFVVESYGSDNFGRRDRVEPLLKLFKKYKGQLNTADGAGQTVLHKFCSTGVLTEDSQLLNIQNKIGETPLFTCVKNGAYRDFVSSMFRLGANPAILTNNGQSLFHAAVSGGRLESIDTIASNKTIDIDLTDKQGNTALHLAAQSGLSRHTLALLKNNAQRNVVNQEGKTPLSIARNSKKYWTSLALEKYPAIFEAPEDFPLDAETKPVAFVENGRLLDDGRIILAGGLLASGKWATAVNSQGQTLWQRSYKGMGIFSIQTDSIFEDYLGGIGATNDGMILTIGQDSNRRLMMSSFAFDGRIGLQSEAIYSLSSNLKGGFTQDPNGSVRFFSTFGNLANGDILFASVTNRPNTLTLARYRVQGGFNGSVQRIWEKTLTEKINFQWCCNTIIPAPDGGFTIGGKDHYRFDQSGNLISTITDLGYHRHFIDLDGRFYALTDDNSIRIIDLTGKEITRITPEGADFVHDDIYPALNGEILYMHRGQGGNYLLTQLTRQGQIRAEAILNAPIYLAKRVLMSKSGYAVLSTADYEMKKTSLVRLDQNLKVLWTKDSVE